MELLVTGSSGFVGKNLLPYLSGYDFKVDPLSLRGSWLQKLFMQYNGIIHMAGKAHDISNVDNPKEYFQVNTELTRQLFDQFLVSSARDFIYFSSIKAVADTTPDLLTEELHPNPQTPYGQSKLRAEEYLLEKDIPQGKRLIILRPCMIHGPGNKGNLTLLYNIVNKGIPWPLAAFENSRSFLSVDNICYIVKSILRNPAVPSGVYHVADDEPLSTNELVSLIAKTTGKKPRLMRIPGGFVKRLAKVGDTFHLPLNSERLKKLTESYVVSNQKIKDALGIQSLPLSSRDGLVKTINSFR